MPSDAVPISKRLVLINSVSSVIARLINAGVAIWVIQYLVRRIDEAEYELLPVLMSALAFITLFSIVFTSGIARYVTDAMARDDQRGVTRVVSSIAPVTFAMAGFVAVGGALLVWQVDAVLDVDPQYLADARLMLGLLVASSAISVALSAFRVGLYARQRFVLVNLIHVGSTLLRVALLLSLILGIGPTVVWVVVATVAASLIDQILQSVISMRLVPELRVRFGAFDWATVKELTGYGIWMSVGHLASTIRNMTDPLLLNWMATPIDVTAFHIGNTADRQLRQMTITASGPLLPALTAMHARKQPDRLSSAFYRGGRYSLWFFGLVAVPLIVFRNEVMSLYLGESFEKFRDAANVTALIMLASTGAYSMRMGMVLAQATAKIRAVVFSGLAAQIVNVGLTIVLVGHYKLGAMGAAIATLAVTCVHLPFVHWPVLCHQFGLRTAHLLRRTAGPGLIPMLVTALTLEALRRLMPPESWAFIAGWGLVGAGIYATVVWMCMALDDRRLAGRIVGGAMRRLGISRRLS